MYFFKLRQYRNLLGSGSIKRLPSSSDSLEKKTGKDRQEISPDADHSSEFSETESRETSSSQVVSSALPIKPCSAAQSDNPMPGPLLKVAVVNPEQVKC